MAIRINPAGIALIMARTWSRSATAAADFIVLAKAESAKEVHDAGWLMGKPVLAMVETPQAVIDAAAIAPRLARPDRRHQRSVRRRSACRRAAGAQGLVYALQRIVLAARAAGVPAFDGVYNGLEADEGLAAECAEGRAWGFDGKSVIHPSQIETANRIFAPTEAELDAARRLVEAATGGAERHEGRMIEAMHVEQAHALIAKARR